MCVNFGVCLSLLVLVELDICTLCRLVVDFDSPSNIFYGIGGSITWKRISRNLNVDLVKALLNAHASKLKVKVLKVSFVNFFEHK